jgi:hypothetical protein
MRDAPPVIDPATGTLYFQRVETRLSPALTRAAFLASPLGAHARVWAQNEPHCSYRAEVTIGAERFAVIPQFSGQTLQGVTLALTGGRWGTSWADWSEESEGERQCAHDAWLREQLGPSPYTYAWGAIESFYDPRSGSSAIMIQYQTAPPPRPSRTPFRRWFGRS